MVILSNTYSVVKTLLEAQVSVYSLRVSLLSLVPRGRMRTDTARKVAYIGFCVFTSISVVVLFGWDQRNGEIAEC